MAIELPFAQAGREKQERKKERRRGEGRRRRRRREEGKGRRKGFWLKFWSLDFGFGKF